jgi:hypothetical protein
MATHERIRKLLDELNDLEQRYGRVPAAADPNYDVAGEVRARIDLLKGDLESCGVEIAWDGQQYRVVGPKGP